MVRPAGWVPSFGRAACRVLCAKGKVGGVPEEGRTMLLVTHELGFAYHFANRVLFIADGVIHEQGTPDEVLKNPQQARTQAFLARHNEFHF